MELCLAWMTIKMWIVAVKMPFFLLAHIMFPEQVREKRKEMHLQGVPKVPSSNFMYYNF